MAGTDTALDRRIDPILIVSLRAAHRVGGTFKEFALPACYRAGTGSMSAAAERRDGQEQYQDNQWQRSLHLHSPVDWSHSPELLNRHSFQTERISVARWMAAESSAAMADKAAS